MRSDAAHGTLLVRHQKEYMAAVEKCGADYGLAKVFQADSKLGSEISRIIGIVAAELSALNTVCKHATLPMARKLRLFNAFALSKLRYGLA